MRADSVVFHAGYYSGTTPEQTYAAIKKELVNVASIVRHERLPVTLRMETMGKRSQFGTLDEVLSMCRDIEGIEPCLDFAHIHAREGRVNCFEDFERVLARVARKLGAAASGGCMSTWPGYSTDSCGEIKHLNMAEADFRYDEWLEAMHVAGAAGLVICESPNLEQDALLLKEIYDGLKDKLPDIPARPEGWPRA